MLDIFIEFDVDFYGSRIYYVGATDSLHRPPLWVSKDGSLSRVKENRVFTRSYDTAVHFAKLISKGTIKEGISLNLFNAIKAV